MPSHHSSDPTQTPAMPAPVSPPLLTTPGLWRRMACWLYEGVLLFAVVFFAGWLFSTLGQVRDPTGSRRHLLQAFMFVVLGIYFVFFWHKGQTLAMKTWNIRVVDRQGQALTQGRALLRYVLSWVWFVPPLAIIARFKLGGGEISVLVIGWVAIWALLARFHPERQFWHDAWAGSRLIHSKPMSR